MYRAPLMARVAPAQEIKHVGSNERFQANGAAERRKNATIYTITCRGDPSCGMLSFYPNGECSSPSAFAGSFYLRTGLVRPKAQSSGSRPRTRRKSPKGLWATDRRSGSTRRERAYRSGGQQRTSKGRDRTGSLG